METRECKFIVAKIIDLPVKELAKCYILGSVMMSMVTVRVEIRNVVNIWWIWYVCLCARACV